mgnify:CR=1 FL=1
MAMAVGKSWQGLSSCPGKPGIRFPASNAVSYKVVVLVLVFVSVQQTVHMTGGGYGWYGFPRLAAHRYKTTLWCAAPSFSA